VLEEALKLESANSTQDILYFRRMVVIHLGLARSMLHRFENKYKNTTAESVEEHFTNCLSAQQKVLTEMKDERAEVVQEQKKFYAEISFE